MALRSSQGNTLPSLVKNPSLFLHQKAGPCWYASSSAWSRGHPAEVGGYEAARAFEKSDGSASEANCGIAGSSTGSLGCSIVYPVARQFVNNIGSAGADVAGASSSAINWGAKQASKSSCGGCWLAEIGVSGDSFPSPTAALSLSISVVDSISFLVRAS